VFSTCGLVGNVPAKPFPTRSVAKCRVPALLKLRDEKRQAAGPLLQNRPFRWNRGWYQSGRRQRNLHAFL